MGMMCLDCAGGADDSDVAAADEAAARSGKEAAARSGKLEPI